MACYTQQEIAEAVNVDQSIIAKFMQNGNLAKIHKTPQSQHQIDFTPPIYNVWKQQNKTNDVNHPGNTEITFLDNLLYFYTNPLDIVIDPFAGGGSTIDICKKRSRRYWVSDRQPIVEREDEIRLHDVTEGLPPLHRWKDVKLVYLDPPYWKQAEDKYSDSPNDLANMSLDEFTGTLANLIKKFAKKISDAYIALIIQPTQWKSPDKQFTDHVGDMLRRVNLTVDMRYSCPFESQQCTAQMVEWAKENKKTLVLSREIIVWRID